MLFALHHVKNFIGVKVKACLEVLRQRYQFGCIHMKYAERELKTMTKLMPERIAEIKDRYSDPVILQLLDAAEMLMEARDYYMQHKDKCTRWGIASGVCSCGLAALLAKIERIG